MGKVRKYANNLLRNQNTCVGSRDQINVLRTADLMDVYIQRKWWNKLYTMRITIYDGYLNKIHIFALSIISKLPS